MAGVSVVNRQDTGTDITDTLQLREVAMATTFWLPSGNNFGFVVTSDTLFDIWVAFGVKLSDIAEIKGLRGVAMATAFGTTLAVNGLCREITT